MIVHQKMLDTHVMLTPDFSKKAINKARHESYLAHVNDKNITTMCDTMEIISPTESPEIDACNYDDTFILSTTYQQFSHGDSNRSKKHINNVP